MAVLAAAVWTGTAVKVCEPAQFVRDLRRAKWGDGQMLVVRVEPPEDALTEGQRRHYFGHIVAPLSEWNGDFRADWHLLLKSMFMPEGKTSITQLSYDEMQTYTEQCEVYAHTSHPDAFALLDYPLRSTTREHHQHESGETPAR